MQFQARNISTRHARRIIVRAISNFSNIFSLLDSRSDYYYYYYYSLMENLKSKIPIETRKCEWKSQTVYFLKINFSYPSRVIEKSF